MSKTNIKLNTNELKQFLKHIIVNNRLLQQTNKIPVAVNVEGESGIGKTSAILQVAQEMDLHMVKLNLSQIEELGDLTGFPVKEFQLCQEEKCIWVVEHAIEEYIKHGYVFTGLNRMSYCPPEWISNTSKGGILLLDDWNRADTRFLQAVMELIDRQQYISWKLPEDWHIILSSNPDNGTYLVNSIDNAQKTRFISINLKFDKDCWAVWAENNQIDSRCINFLLMHPELITTEVNARSAVMFFNSISSLQPFDDHLPLIQMIGEGSVGDEFSSMFTMFINNRLDKIISPQDILFHKSEEYVIKTLKSVIGKDTQYRADIASIIVTRIVNYALFYAKDNNVDKTLVERISSLVTEDIFAADLRYNIVKQVYNGNQSKFKLLTMKKELLPFIMK
jgi:hypothetical protein